MNLEYFQLIDRIEDIKSDASEITTFAQVPQKSTIFEGHFPGHPIMPGVLLCEAMAQTCGWMLIAYHNFEKMPFLAGLKSAKLRSFVEPEQALKITGNLDHCGSGYAMASATIKRDGKSIVSSQLTFRIMPFPDEKFAQMMRTKSKELNFPEKTFVTEANSNLLHTTSE